MVRHPGLARFRAAWTPLALVAACGARTTLPSLDEQPGSGGSGAAGGGGTSAGSGGFSSSGSAGIGGSGTGGSGASGASGGSGGLAPRCGNAIVEAGEGCDDGNARSADGCSPECRRIADVAMGSYHTCILLDDGGVKCWGYNFHGELGTGNQNYIGNEPGELSGLAAIDLGSGRRAVALAAGFFHTCAILDTGQVKCWGSNVRGQLGLGDGESRGDDPGEMGDALPAVDLGSGRHALALGAGYQHTCALLDDRSVKCWGFNLNGQLGLGDTEDRGDDPDEMGELLPAVPLAGGTVRALAVGSSFNCVLFDDGRVQCWGENGQGQLGLEDTADRGAQPGELGAALPFVDLGERRTVRELFARGSACALLDDGDLKCWGMNQNGLLGLGSTEHRGDQPDEMGEALPAIDLGGAVVSLGLGLFHACARLQSGAVKCWGANLAGQLGLGDTLARGDQPGEMGGALPAVQLGPRGMARKVAAGDDATCALLEDWTLRCWGLNTYGQLGLGHSESQGDEPGEMASLRPVNVP